MGKLFAYRVRYINNETLEIFETQGIAAAISMASLFTTINSWYSNVETVEIEHLTDGLYEIGESTYKNLMTP